MKKPTYQEAIQEIKRQRPDLFSSQRKAAKVRAAAAKFYKGIK